MCEDPKVEGYRVRHQVVFHLGDGTQTEAEFVDDRLVWKITSFPEGTTQIEFFDVVETQYRMPDDTTTSVFGEPTDRSECYNVFWDHVVYERIYAACPRMGIKVHPSLEGHVFVVATTEDQVKEQTASAHV